MTYQKPNKLKSLHLDIYDASELELYHWLKKRSGIKTDADLIRWAFTQLKIKLDQEEKDREFLRERVRKAQIESEELDK